MTEPGPIRRIAEPIVRDVVGLAGLGTLIHGVHAFSAAGAEILGGGLMVGACLFWARNRG